MDVGEWKVRQAIKLQEGFGHGAQARMWDGEEASYSVRYVLDCGRGRSFTWTGGPASERVGVVLPLPAPRPRQGLGQENCTSKG